MIGPGNVRGKIFRGPGKNPTIFLVQDRSGAFFWAVRGKYGAIFLAGTRHDFVKFIGAKRTCTDIRRIIVKLSGSLTTPYGMASLLKNF